MVIKAAQAELKRQNKEETKWLLEEEKRTRWSRVRGWCSFTVCLVLLESGLLSVGTLRPLILTCTDHFNNNFVSNIIAAVKIK